MKFADDDGFDGIDGEVLDAVVDKHLAPVPMTVAERVRGAVLDGFLVGRDFTIRDRWADELRESDDGES